MAPTADKRAHLPERGVELDDVSHYSSTSRIHGLSDGVFSIAMTLLAFSLIEHIPKAPLSPSEFLSELGQSLLVYLISFIILGTYWVGHAIQFHYVIRADRPLMVSTVLFLLFVSIVPFSAAYLGSFTHDRVAIGVYCLNLALCGLFLSWTLHYATKDPLMLHPAMDKRIFRGIRAAFLSGPIMYAIAFVVAIASPVAAFVLCVATPMLTFFPNPFWGRIFARAVGNRLAAEEEEEASAR